jgi:ribokinase
MTKRIVVVGSINLDLVARVERMPALGETVSGQDLQTFCGGKGANQAVAAARLGAPVAMIGRLGDDHFAGYLRANLANAGVDTSRVECVTGPSGTALISTTPREKTPSLW